MSSKAWKWVALAMLIAILSVPFLAQAQVYEQRNINNHGMPIIRFLNNTPYPVSCFYRDQANFYTFIISPGTSTYWILIYGQYQWGCK